MMVAAVVITITFFFYSFAAEKGRECKERLLSFVHYSFTDPLSVLLTVEKGKEWSQQTKK